MATLVLLHGFAATNFTWRDVEGPLRDAGHDVIALERPFEPPFIAASKVIDELDIRRIDEVVLVGHSAGADVAVRVTNRIPNRVCGLVLSAPVVGGGPPPIVRSLAGLPVVRDVAPALLRVGVRVGLPLALKQTWADKSLVTDDVVEGFRRPLLAPGAMEALWTMTRGTAPSPPDWDALRATPTLVIKGDHDTMTTEVPLPKAKVLTYDRCGHLPHEERADRFVKDVLRFVSEVA